MAPRKEKAEKVSADAAVDTILSYLRKQNRPYSATDISANLHNKVTKAAAAKILKELHEKKEIEGRAAGKQIVYHVIQDPADSPTPESLAAIDAEIQSTRDETATANATLKSLKQTLGTLNSTLSTTDLRDSVDKLETEKKEILGRLNKLHSGSIKPISTDEKRKVDEDAKKWEKVEKRRHEIFNEMWAVIVDGVGDQKKVEEIKEQLGIED